MTDDATIVTPQVLTRIRLRVCRWPNRSASRSTPLIESALLENVYAALDQYIAFIKHNTLPTVVSNERLIPDNAGDLPPWLLMEADVDPEHGINGLIIARAGMTRLAGDVQHPLVQLVRAIKELEIEWPTLLQQAKERLGTKFDDGDFLSTDQLSVSFVVLCEKLGAENTHAMLANFSMYHPVEQPQKQGTDIFEAIDLARNLEQLRQERSSNKISEEEYLRKSTEAMGLSVDCPHCKHDE